MIDPASTWIDAGVTIGKDTVLYPNVMLEGHTVIGEDCIVRSGTRITDCTVGNGVEILDHCVFRESHIEDGATLGPFTHLRPACDGAKGSQDRELRRSEKNGPGRRVESESSQLSGRRNNRQRRQHRRRDDHVQL